MEMLFDVQASLLDDSNEWYTQGKYIAAAVEVMGAIELDPASCQQANQTIKANRYYTYHQNGLVQDWTCCSMWLNPPFGNTSNGKSSMATWATRLMEEYAKGSVNQAILLCMANTEASWFAPLWDRPICFPSPRVYFDRPYGKMNHHIQGTCFVYFGEEIQRFVSAFQRFGPVVTPDGVHRTVSLHVQQSFVG